MTATPETMIGVAMTAAIIGTIGPTTINRSKGQGKIGLIIAPTNHNDHSKTVGHSNNLGKTMLAAQNGHHRIDRRKTGHHKGQEKIGPTSGRHKTEDHKEMAGTGTRKRRIKFLKTN